MHSIQLAFRIPGNTPSIFIKGNGNSTLWLRSFDREETEKIKGTLIPYKKGIVIMKDSPNEIIPSISFEEYKKQFKHYLEDFKNKGIQKAILSRVIKTNRSSIDLEFIFERLCELFPNAFVYAGCFGKFGFWVGASPEKLVEWNCRRAKTTALAGTQKKGEANLFGSKEYEEHTAVSSYIENIKHEFNLLNKSEVYLKEAGEVVHLKQDFEFEVSYDKLDSFISLLHPTPAVCGLPKRSSYKLIKEVENHSRSLYTGFIGIEDEDSTTMNSYVNLRCMKIVNDSAYIYVGGGITSESDVLKEWRETELKSRTMMSVL